MYTQIKTIGLPRYIATELPALLVAFVVAEVFYKFGSFALECAAFLATWLVLSLAHSQISGLLGRD